jgi:hypothetical protein
VLALLAERTVITRPAPSLLAPSTIKPRGTRVDGRKACRMTLIPFVKPTPASA